MIIFKNKGLIDEKSITTFGVSSKENESAIGYFGTGLKYAIAILIREGCEIKIHIGKKVLSFGKQQEKIRVNDFTFITMNDVALSFTTELGKKWELWQAFRELYCNCIDENGDVFESDMAECLDTETMICVSGKAFTELFYNKDEFILNTKPIVIGKNCDIHDGASNFIFYKGISVFKLTVPSLYTYNLKGSIDLTEDRTLKYHHYCLGLIAKDILNMSDVIILEKILCANDNFLEHNFDYNGEPSQQFIDLCLEAARKFNVNINKSARKLCNGWILEAFSHNSDYQINDIEKKMLVKAIDFCKFIGHDTLEYEIKFSEFLGENVLGRAHNNVIYLSKRVFMQGTKQVAATLLEEYLHLKYNLVDETYMMQTFLFDLICGLGERLKGEPL